MYCSDACRWRAWYRRHTRTPVYRHDWWTPAAVRSHVLTRYDVRLDAAACVTSRLVERYLGPDHPDEAMRDALRYSHGWQELCPTGWVYLCPPYRPVTQLSRFLDVAVRTAAAGVPVVGLVPASTSARWWWRHVADVGGQPEFLRERLVFGGPHATGRAAPWGSALVTWTPATVHQQAR